MAEFQVVMKQAKRMCGQIADCNECPLDLPEGCRMQPYSLPHNWDVEEFEKAADIVMDWAAQNPEPRYPTWNEWQEANFPEGCNAGGILPCRFVGKEEMERITGNECNGFFCRRCANTEISADIAEKLGIKPIGGNADA